MNCTLSITEATNQKKVWCLGLFFNKNFAGEAGSELNVLTKFSLLYSFLKQLHNIELMFIVFAL